ncbi:MAG: T9SS type A sorting domain-containing protein [Saprospiraceae bacterium]|nr:T9SS type A sorting domain-containing protein [Saprospiraceae bacterium]
MQFTIQSQPCLTGNLIFTTQAEIDNFPNLGCTQIVGNLTISGANITNLNGLSTITSISEALIISDNLMLADLSGLDGLVSLSSLQVYNNPNMTSLIGLNAQLDTINGDVFISNNNLTNLIGLGNITTIESGLQISDSPVLNVLFGLESLTSIQGSLFVGESANLVNLTGLTSLNYVGGGIEIYNNASMTSLSGINSGITAIGGGINIYGNPTLSSLGALSNIVTIEGIINISNNAALTSLNGLHNINASGIFNLIITNSSLLTYCEVNSVCEYLSGLLNFSTIENNAQNCESKEIIIQNCFSILSVELTKFEGFQKGKNNFLEWKTVSEINHDYFEVQSSKDGINFQPKEIIKSKENNQGTSQEYSYLDETPWQGINYYRLKQVDRNNNFIFSKTVSINNIQNNSTIKVYPNPAVEFIYIDIEERNQPLHIIDLFGNIVFQSNIISEKIDISSLSSGLYSIKIGTNLVKLLITR